MESTLGIVLLLAVSARTAPLPATEDLLDNADVLSIEQALCENLPPELELPNAEDWQSFWNQVETILQSQSLDDMNWFCSTVRQACEYFNGAPITQPWADWLRPRLDYFEMACVAVQEIPAKPAIPRASAPHLPSTSASAVPDAKPSPPPVPAVIPAAHDVHGIMPKTPPAKATVSPQVTRKRHNLIRSSNRWQEKLANRPMPPNAAVLIPRLKKVFQSEGLPPELVWMAEVESSLNPAARSPVGALGLFQFMPATARRFGLRTGLFDERKDPVKSARAAAQYLKILYRTMGSWPLALAAYNAGEGRVGKLVKRKPQTAFDDIADDLPLETQMYVPKVLALISLRENADLEKLPGPAAAVSLRPVILFFEPFSALANVCPKQLNCVSPPLLGGRPGITGLGMR
ncbi:MAG: lytic transglycosylase domain-containing protein [Verrucomicrobiota bacterium]